MKKKIIFLPGAWANELLFAPQIGKFGKEYDVITPNIAQFDDIEKMAEAIVKEHPNVYCIVGLSMGGFIALEILTKHPQFAEKAILMGTYAHALDADSRNFILNKIKEVQEGKLPALSMAYTDVVLSENAQDNPELLKTVQKIPLTVGEQGCINHHKACLKFSDKTKQLKNITAKTLIICSEADKAVPVEEHYPLHENILNSELIILKKGGHFMTLENPDEINWHINQWLEK